MHRLESKDVSFVVQGPVIFKTTSRVLESIRKHFPRSTIILSTWKGEDVEGLVFDNVVFNEDPGANFPYLARGTANNNNRQIVSTKNGLSKVTTLYAVKTRTDTVFISSKLLKEMWVCAHLKMELESRLFHQHLLIPSNFTINPRKTLNLVFHPSDFFLAGRTDDLGSLFDIPLMSSSDMSWFNSHRIPSHACVQDLVSRYANEQYIFTSFLKKHTDLNFDNAFESTEENIELTEKYFANLFYLRSTRSLGINNKKYPQNILTKSDHIYTECEWNKLFIKYVDHEYPDCIDIFKFANKISEVIRFLGKKLLTLIRS